MKTKARVKAASPIVTVIRVKNEEKYIGHALASLEALGGTVIVLDDGSTDGTATIIRSFPFVNYHWQLGLEMDEGRDRTYLYKEALKLKPKWIFTLDGDEVLDPETPAKMLRAVTNCPNNVNVFALLLGQMATLPTEPKQKWFGPPSIHTAPRMFRVRDADRGHVFTGEFDGGLHCGSIPPLSGGVVKQDLNAFVRAYGYESAEQQEIKLKKYEADPRAHAARVRQLKDFNKLLSVPWVDGACCREMGKHGTVDY